MHQVPQVVNVVKYVPKTEIRERIKYVPKYEVKTINKYVEVPIIKVVDRYEEILQVQEVLKPVTKNIVVEVSSSLNWHLDVDPQVMLGGWRHFNHCNVYF